METVERAGWLERMIKPVSAIASPSPLFELDIGTGLEASGSQGAMVVMVRSLGTLDNSPPLNLPPPSAGCVDQPSNPSNT